MQDAAYAYRVFKKHFNESKLAKDFTTLELGPGDSLFAAAINYSLGGKKSYLVDTGYYASRSVEFYRNFNIFLESEKLPTKDLSACSNLEDILKSYEAFYLTRGLDSLRKIPSNSVDFIFSQAVLEHIKKREFTDVIKELRRIVKDTGYCSHTVDLKDHLGDALNNLRFTEKIWESNFMSSSGFYTNRIRYSEMIDIFKEAGFEISHIYTSQWEQLPTPRSKLAFPFKNMDEKELSISGFSIVLSPV
ncbi:methyltransferase domain-containing protein [Oscillatoria sp. FACHB-1406]|nr:methyltransferase domain-containing protein [Oscillatoria sp. FACHB-1406]